MLCKLSCPIINIRAYSNRYDKQMNDELFCCKTINSCCIDVVTNQTTYIKCFLCSNYTNQNATIHVLTPKSAGQWPMQKSYKNRLRIQKEGCRPYDFCREANKVSWAYCMRIVHARSTIFGTYILYISSINNVKKIFISDKNILCMCTQYKFAALAFETLSIIVVQVI